MSRASLSSYRQTAWKKLARVLELVDKSSELEDYLAWFRHSIPVMQTETALERIAFELAEDNAQENVRYLEVRFCPALHTGEGLRVEAVVDAVLAGLARAEQTHAIKTGLIITALRDGSESESLRLSELAVEYAARGVVAFDLASAEAGHPAKGPFAGLLSRPQCTDEHHGTRRRSVGARVHPPGAVPMWCAPHRPRDFASPG